MNKKDNVAVHRLSFNVHRYDKTGIPWSGLIDFDLTLTINKKLLFPVYPFEGGGTLVSIGPTRISILFVSPSWETM